VQLSLPIIICSWYEFRSAFERGWAWFDISFTSHGCVYILPRGKTYFHRWKCLNLIDSVTHFLLSFSSILLTYMHNVKLILASWFYHYKSTCVESKIFLIYDLYGLYKIKIVIRFFMIIQKALCMIHFIKLSPTLMFHII